MLNDKQNKINNKIFNNNIHNIVNHIDYHNEQIYDNNTPSECNKLNGCYTRYDRDDVMNDSDQCSEKEIKKKYICCIIL